jgi:hypothetical protein
VRRLRGRSAATNNLFWRNGSDESDSTVADARAVRADPRLDSEQRLEDGSAAIDAGATSFAHGGVELIPAGSWSGAAPDLGAFERE